MKRTDADVLGIDPKLPPVVRWIVIASFATIIVVGILLLLTIVLS